MFDLEQLKKSLNLDSLLNPNNLATYRRADSLKQQINEAVVQWQTTLSDFEKSKTRLSEIEATAKSINLSNIKTPQDASTMLNNIKTASTNANEIKKTFTERKTVLSDAVNKFSGSIKDLDDLGKQDFRNIVSLAKLPDVSMTGIAEILLGKDMLRKAYEYLGYVEMARTKIKSTPSKPAMETPKRMRGQNIQFPIERAYPKFWIKKILISGGTDQKQDPQYFYAKGQVLNISNDQHITGYPITMDISATKGGSTNLTLGASFDRRKELAVDQYKASLTGLPVDDMTLGRSDFLPSKITQAIANTSINMTVPGNHFEGIIDINFTNMKIIFQKDPRNTVERIVKDVLTAINGFNVNLRMWKDARKFDIAFATNFDDQIASRTKQVLGAELQKIQNDIRNKVNAKIAEKRAEVEKLYNEKRSMVMNKVKDYENILNDKVSIVDNKKKEVEKKKKEVENRIEGEKKKQTDTVKKKAQDAIKGLFKK